MGEELGPGRPRSIGNDGGGAWVMVSHCRQLILGRTWTTTLKCDGTYSSTSRSSLPIRLSFLLPHAGQTQVASCSTRSRGRWAEQRLTAPGAPLVALGRTPKRHGTASWRASCSAVSLFEIADQQLELLEPLGGLAEAGPLHECQRRAQLLDVQRLRMDLGVTRGKLALLGGERVLQQAASARRAWGSKAAKRLPMACLLLP